MQKLLQLQIAELSGALGVAGLSCNVAQLQGNSHANLYVGMRDEITKHYIFLFCLFVKI